MLDVGCGIGWLVRQFARGGANITGVELSDNSLALARKRLDYEGLNAELIKGNAQDLPFPDASLISSRRQACCTIPPTPRARSIKSIACCGQAGGQ